MESVQVTLTQHPQILIGEKQVSISAGKLQETKGQFDISLNLSLSHDITKTPLNKLQKLQAGISKTTTTTTDHQFSLGRQLRSGFLWSSGVELTQTDVTPDPLEPVASSSVFLGFTQPLLRGRGKSVNTAAEQAARLDVDATELELYHTITQQILGTVVAYWKYAAAHENLAILRESEKRAEKLVQEIQTLINADEVPAAEIIQLKANLLDKRAARIAAEQTLFTSTQNLLLAMGLSPENTLQLPPPGDSLTIVKPVDPAAAQKDSIFVEKALKMRMDLLALQKRAVQTEKLLIVAKNKVKPNFNLNLQVGYAGLDEGGGVSPYFGSLYNNAFGLNVQTSLIYDYPLGNHTARGQLSQNLNSFQQVLLRIEDLTRNIRSGVLVALEDLRSSSLQLQKYEDAVGLYERSVANEEKKYKLGISTLIDVINTQDRLTSAYLNRTAAQLSYAAAVAQLRFATGTLLDLSEKDRTILMKNLMTVPGES